MTIQNNKQLVLDHYAAIEREAWDEVGMMCHPDFTFYPQIDTPFVGAAGFIASEKRNFDAVPGFTVRVHDMVAENDKVGAYVVIEAVQSKPMMGRPANGAKLRFSMFNLFTIKDGKILEKRAHFDVDDIKRQLDATA